MRISESLKILVPLVSLWLCPGAVWPLDRGTIVPIGMNGITASVQLLEFAPSNFLGLTDRNVTYILTSQGTVTPFCKTPTTGGLTSYIPIQAVNGRVYGSGWVSQGNKNTYLNFSFDLNCNFQTYPNQYAPVFALAMPDGTLYGTQFGNATANAFVRMTLDGSLAVLHSFSAHEGGPAGPPKLADDGNFYGMSGNTVRLSVYRVTPKGDLTILATHPEGTAAVNYALGITIVQASNGMIYGVDPEGGSHKAGAIWRMSLDGKDYKVMYEYPHILTGVPTSLTEASDGNLYGVAQGEDALCACSSLFRISLEGKYEKLQELNPGVVGGCPCWMMQGSDGKFYGSAGLMAWIWDLGLPKPEPRLDGVRPRSGSPGTPVIVWGQNLLGTTAVSFNGVPATSIANISKNFVSAIVPSGATSGKVTLTNMNGTATSPGAFTVQ